MGKNALITIHTPNTQAEYFQWKYIYLWVFTNSLGDYSTDIQLENEGPSSSIIGTWKDLKKNLLVLKKWGMQGKKKNSPGQNDSIDQY